MPDGPRVLVVDDDRVVRELVRRVLELSGHRVRTAEDGLEALKVLFAEPVDAVLLDVDMPRLDGWATLERIREVSAVPVIMVTAHDADLEVVRGLRGGADDYITKPFATEILAARVEALLRREASGDGAGAPPDRYDDGELAVDHEQRVATAKGTEVRLTPQEFALLAAFVRHPGQVLSADRLIELAWQDPYVERDQVKLYVGRLRRKLAGHLAEDRIETLRGFGYRFSSAS